MKKTKSPKTAHTSNSKVGMGDYKGTGVKNKTGTIRDIYAIDYQPMSSKKMGKPPKSLA